MSQLMSAVDIQSQLPIPILADSLLQRYPDFHKLLSQLASSAAIDYSVDNTLLSGSSGRGSNSSLLAAIGSAAACPDSGDPIDHGEDDGTITAAALNDPVLLRNHESTKSGFDRGLSTGSLDSDRPCGIRSDGVPLCIARGFVQAERSYKLARIRFFREQILSEVSKSITVRCLDGKLATQPLDQAHRTILVSRTTERAGIQSVPNSDDHQWAALPRATTGLQADGTEEMEPVARSLAHAFVGHDSQDARGAVSSAANVGRPKSATFAGSRPPLLGLSAELLHRAAGIPVGHDSAAHNVSFISDLVSEHLRTKCVALWQYCRDPEDVDASSASNVGDAEMLTPSTAMSLGSDMDSLFEDSLQLPAKIEETQLWVRHAQLDLDLFRRSILARRALLHELLVDIWSRYVQVFQRFVLQVYVERDKIHSRWLIERCKTMCLKLSQLKHQFMMDSYTEESVSALQVIRSELDTMLKESQARHDRLQQSVNTYMRLDPSFMQMVNEYVSLCQQVQHKEWALAQIAQPQRNM